MLPAFNDTIAVPPPTRIDRNHTAQVKALLPSSALMLCQNTKINLKIESHYEYLHAWIGDIKKKSHKTVFSYESYQILVYLFLYP